MLINPEIKVGLKKLKELRDQASDDIVKIINDFEEKTGVYIKKLDLRTEFNRGNIVKIDFDLFIS